MDKIPEIDLDELDGDLYRAWNQIQRGDYYHAECLVAKSWRHVHLFRISFDDSHLPATTDRDPLALATKLVYGILNRIGWRGIRGCHKHGLECEYVYPYGFVPEGGCPKHD